MPGFPAIPAARIQVAVALPQHSGLAAPLDYAHTGPLACGTLVRVPLGRRVVSGLVWPGSEGASAAGGGASDGAHGSAAELRPIDHVLASLPPLSESWCALVDFAAGYYQRSVGELALAALPAALLRFDDAQLAMRIARALRDAGGPRGGAAPSAPDPAARPAPGSTEASAHGPEPEPAPGSARPALNAEQAAATRQLADAQAAAPESMPAAVLLHGVTGSGKTEVYLRAAERALDAGRQAMVLVPEINLTPQLEARVAERFEGRRIVSLHSALTPAQRLRGWLAAHLGLADLVLGTRLAVFASMPRLGLIVVDEEHDPSYKQQEGARYSARDLAVYRAKLENAVAVLGSATPSLETWQRANSGRYARVTLAARVGGGPLPQVRVVDMNALPKASRTISGPADAVSPPLLAALHERLARGEQSLVFLNRRGYAPVLHCGECGWKSGCPNCSAWRVFHKIDRSLRCHHCGLAERVPRACPACGNLDIAPIGRGTERLEEQLGAALRDAGGRPARIARIDADSTRTKGALEARLAAVHAGEVDVLVGTQMIAKGHDFRRITLVAAVNPDGALFSSDFRAPERLFALLMQAGGRAGRDAAQAGRSEMWLQTWHPTHALYTALRRHDFAAFAVAQLREREMAGLPPYSHLAMLRADAHESEPARAFLQGAADCAAALTDGSAVLIYPPVPASVARVANVERMQMLVESASRAALQRFLTAWLPALHALRRAEGGPAQRILRWAIDVDPLTI